MVLNGEDTTRVEKFIHVLAAFDFLSDKATGAFAQKGASQKKQSRLSIFFF